MSLTLSSVSTVSFYLSSIIAENNGFSNPSDKDIKKPSPKIPPPKVTAATVKPKPGTATHTNAGTETATTAKTNTSFATVGTDSQIGTKSTTESRSVTTSQISTETSTPTMTPNFPPTSTPTPTLTPSTVPFVPGGSPSGHGNRNKTSNANRLIPGTAQKGWKSAVVMGAIFAVTMSLHFL